MSSEFPKFKYHKTEDAQVVEGKDEEEALGKEWFDSPPEAKAGKKNKLDHVAAVDTKDLDDLKAQNIELAKENKVYVEQLEKAEDHIDELEKQLEEAMKNDHRNEEGQFIKAKDVTEIKASDAAKNLAEENEVDLKDVTGTGADGNITKGDVQTFIDAD